MTRKIIVSIAIFLFVSKSTINPVPEISHKCSGDNCLFDEAVQLIKENEGWHTKNNYPYVGYGHKLTPKDTFNHNISKDFADKLLREDLLQKCAVFRKYGEDSLLLGVLAYNVGEYNILGNKNKSPSKLIKKLNAGNRDIRNEYISFCHHKKKQIPSIKRRRQREFELLYNK